MMKSLAELTHLFQSISFKSQVHIACHIIVGARTEAQIVRLALTHPMGRILPQAEGTGHGST